MLLLGQVNHNLVARYIGLHRNRHDLWRYRCFQPRTTKEARDEDRKRREEGSACDEDALPSRVDKVRMALRRFDLVGLVERFDETLLMIADLTGLQHILISAVNVAHQPIKPRMGELQRTAMGCASLDDCRTQIAAVAPVDVLIYEEARAEFEKRIAAQGPSFAARVTRLREARDCRGCIRRKYKHEWHPKPKTKANSTRQCVGLLEGESEVSRELCEEVIANTQYAIGREYHATFAEDSMHTKTSYWRRSPPNSPRRRRQPPRSPHATAAAIDVFDAARAPATSSPDPGS